MILERAGGLLHRCSRLKSYANGAALHGTLIKAGTESDLFLSNHLINLYAKCCRLDSAQQVFDDMPNRNLVSWSALISGYDQAGSPSVALNLFARLNLRPNEYVYASVLNACADLLVLAPGKQVHADVLKTGYLNVSFVSNSLMSMYIECGYLDEADSIFRTTMTPDAVSYNAMISGFANDSQPEKGLELFRDMNQQGLRPDQFSFVAVLAICSTSEDLDTGLGLQCQTIKLGLDITAFVGKVILTMYSKCNAFTEVEKAFVSIKEKDVITWNTYIVACSRCGDHAKALMVYKEMVKMADVFGVSPDAFTLASALAACADLALIRYGGQIHAHLIRNMVDIDVGVGNALVDMYSKCGCIRHASQMFDLMLTRNLVSWNTMIVGLGNHGHGKKALEIFEKMMVAGILPDSVTFIGVLAACSHAGLVNKGLAYFNSLEETYSISPGIEHLSCLIDLLGRAGRLQEAENYVLTSRFKDHRVVWGSLLSSCRLHGDVAVGQRAARRLLETRPGTSSPFVLLSNLYATDEKWSDVAEARKSLKDAGVRKEPGHSIIEVKGVMEKFTAGNFSHARMEEVRETLEGLCSHSKQVAKALQGRE